MLAKNLLRRVLKNPTEGSQFTQPNFLVLISFTTEKSVILFILIRHQWLSLQMIIDKNERLSASLN